MIIWHSVKESLPADNQTCWITGPNAAYIVGPIVYKAPTGWLDFCATPEAGEIYTVEDGISHWTEEENINEPEVYEH